MIIKEKAFAYITNGRCLLIFRHLDYPEAGWQVPAGTIKPGESPETAVLREAEEETGLTGLSLKSFLGTEERDMSDYGKQEIHRRYFYHLRYPGKQTTSWEHNESDPSDGSSEIIRLELFWVALPDDLPPLIADHAAMVPRLLQTLQPTGFKTEN